MYLGKGQMRVEYNRASSSFKDQNSGGILSSNSPLHLFPRNLQEDAEDFQKAGRMVHIPTRVGRSMPRVVPGLAVQNVGN